LFAACGLASAILPLCSDRSWSLRTALCFVYRECVSITACLCDRAAAKAVSAALVQHFSCLPSILGMVLLIACACVCCYCASQTVRPVAAAALCVSSGSHCQWCSCGGACRGSSLSSRPCSSGRWICIRRAPSVLYSGSLPSPQTGCVCCGEPVGLCCLAKHQLPGRVGDRRFKSTWLRCIFGISVEGCII